MGAWRRDERGDDRAIVNNHSTVIVLGNIQPVGLGEMESIKPIQTTSSCSSVNYCFWKGILIPVCKRGYVSIDWYVARRH